MKYVVNSQSGGGGLKRAELGRVSNGAKATYDVTSYPGWENYTEENFSAKVTTVYAYSWGDGSRTITGTGGSISYDNTTGVVTFNILNGHTGGSMGVATSVYGRIDYLYYVE